MPSEKEQNKEHSKVSLRIGDVELELEGTEENIKKLMNKELYDFTKGLVETKKQIPPFKEETPKTQEAAPKVTTVPPSSKPLTTSEPPSKPPCEPIVAKKPEKMGERKINWKRSVMALVLVSIVLSAALVSVLAIYLPMVGDLNSQLADRDAEIEALSTQLFSLNTQISSLQADLDQSNTTIQSLQQGIQSLNTQIQYTQSLLLLNASTSLITSFPVSQNASSDTSVFLDVISYAGYIVVSGESTSATTYVRLRYASFGVDYDQNVTLAESGTARFPALPGQIELRVGNTDTYAGDFINATISAIYYY
jgi:hypothetical protein